MGTEPTEGRPTGGASSMPARCQRCHAEMVWPVVCEACHTLYPPREQVDYFEMLGVPREYDLDLERLRKNFLALNRRVHPDFFGTEGDDVRDASMRIAAGINAAYETLRDPIRRAEYMLHLCGGPSSNEDKSVPAELLGTVMAWRDEIEEAREAKDAARLKDLAERIAARRREETAMIAALAGQVCEAQGEAVQQELRRRLNANQYWMGLLRQVEVV